LNQNEATGVSSKKQLIVAHDLSAISLGFSRPSTLCFLPFLPGKFLLFSAQIRDQRFVRVKKEKQSSMGTRRKMLPLIIQLISGAVGGNVAGALMKNFNLGPIGNSIAGLINRWDGGYWFRYGRLFDPVQSSGWRCWRSGGDGLD
jgi:hypothetical protein